MNISVRARKLAFDRDTMWIELDDGRSLGVPLAWFPRLMRATAEQRESYRIGYSGNGLHWEDLDEDISVEGLLMRNLSTTLRHDGFYLLTRFSCCGSGGWVDPDGFGKRGGFRGAVDEAFGVKGPGGLQGTSRLASTSGAR